jgi:hypothetical protein
MARHLVAEERPKRRWCEVELELVISVEGILDRLLEPAVGLEPRDLILVLVGEG